MSDQHKDYLGDSVYAAYDGYHIILTTENGDGPTNRIALEPAVLNALADYQKWLGRVLKIRVPEVFRNQGLMGQHGEETP